MLQALGHFSQSLLRPEATNGRWGGEEFCVAMPCAPQIMEMALGRVLTNLSNLRFESEDGRQFQSSFSAGVAWSPQEGQDLRSLVSTADARLYKAKMAGRNRILSH